jgi:hypothetical protein
MSRTVNDWGSLCLAELDGLEGAGTVGRLLAEATGKGAGAVGGDVVTALLALADKLSSPATVKQQIKDLSAAPRKRGPNRRH